MTDDKYDIEVSDNDDYCAKSIAYTMKLLVGCNNIGDLIRKGTKEYVENNCPCYKCDNTKCKRYKGE